MRRASNRPPFYYSTMKILAFDQATKNTGYAVLEDGVLVRHGVLSVKASLDIMERIYRMSDQIVELIVEVKPDVVRFEGVESVCNEKTMMYLANLQGACLVLAKRAGYDVDTIDVSTWRHMLGFRLGSRVKRSELKKQAIDMAAELFEVTCGDDEADAICIACAVQKIFDSKETKGNV